jgi:hypothetical protein
MLKSAVFFCKADSQRLGSLINEKDIPTFVTLAKFAQFWTHSQSAMRHVPTGFSFAYGV